MSEMHRTIIVGKNSAVWKDLSRDPTLAHCIAIGHAEVGSFAFAPSDRVWILSYSRNMDDNQRLFEQLAASSARDFVYVSTATANVDAVTRCYGYPRVKRRCEELAAALLKARIVTIGVVFADFADLPAGTTMATSLSRLAGAIAAPSLPSTQKTNLFSPEIRAFDTSAERWAFSAYGALLRLSATKPCLLRPLDLVLRTVKWRWYGYLYLSNRLWLTTTS